MLLVKYLLAGYFVQARGDQRLKLHRQDRCYIPPSLSGTLSFSINYAEVKKQNHFRATQLLSSCWQDARVEFSGAELLCNLLGTMPGVGAQ